MSAACLVVFMTTYLLILPAITISLDQADEEPGFDVEAQGELLFSNEEPDGYDADYSGDADIFAGSDSFDSGELISFDDEGDVSALFGGDGSDSDEVFFSDADGTAELSAEETSGPFEYTYTDEETEWKVSVELLKGATLPSDVQFTAHLIQPYSELEQDTYRKTEEAFAETLKESYLEAEENPAFYQMSFEKDGLTLITEDTYAPARITFRFSEAAPEGNTTIAAGEYNTRTEEAEKRQTLLVPDHNSYTLITDLENAASIIGIAKVRTAEADTLLPADTQVTFETEVIPETEAEAIVETAAETVAEAVAETVSETVAETVAETIAETVAETAAETITETDAETEIAEETETETDRIPETETETIAETIVGTDAETETAEEIETETTEEKEAEITEETETETAAETEVETAEETETETAEETTEDEKRSQKRPRKRS